MEKRVRFTSDGLPWVLLTPQVLIIAVFFFGPAAQAVLQSMQSQESFGPSTEWVGFDNLIEAAAIDGDRRWRRFWTIQFPLLTPTTFLLLVINMVYAFFDTFAIIDATTQGGPDRDTVIMVYKVYQDGVKGGDIGSSAAQSVVLMLIVISLTLLQFRYVEKKVNY